MDTDFTSSDLSAQGSTLLQYLADNGITSLEELSDELAVEEVELEQTLETLVENELVTNDEEQWDITEDGLDALAQQSLPSVRPQLDDLDDLDDAPKLVPIEREFASAGFAIDHEE